VHEQLVDQVCDHPGDRYARVAEPAHCRLRRGVAGSFQDQVDGVVEERGEPLRVPLGEVLQHMVVYVGDRVDVGRGEHLVEVGYLQRLGAVPDQLHVQQRDRQHVCGGVRDRPVRGRHRAGIGAVRQQ